MTAEPTPEEAAAIVAALEVLQEKGPDRDAPSLKRSRWKLAGLLGHQVPQRMRLEGSLWAYSGREGRG